MITIRIYEHDLPEFTETQMPGIISATVERDLPSSSGANYVAYILVCKSDFTGAYTKLDTLVMRDGEYVSLKEKLDVKIVRVRKAGRWPFRFTTEDFWIFDAECWSNEIDYEW